MLVILNNLLLNTSIKVFKSTKNRLRIGSYRAIYRLLNEVMIIEALKIGSRGDIYK